jgi:hypothetical protein
MPKSKTPDLDKIISDSRTEAGVSQDPPDNYDGPPPDPDAPPPPEPEPVVEVPALDPGSPEYQPPKERTALANCVLEDMPEYADTHTVIANTLSFFTYWRARSDPAELCDRTIERLSHLLAHYPKLAPMSGGFGQDPPVA